MIRKFAALGCTCLFLAGCTTPVLKEVRHPGGYPGHMMDQRMFDASSSKDVQLFRAALIISMAARMSTATVRDSKDADAFADYLASAVDELNYTAANIYADTQGNAPCEIREEAPILPDRTCSGYFANFESDIPLLEGRIVRLMLAALPENRARAFLEDVGSGNVLSAAWSAIRAVGEAAGGIRRATGVYRSGLEVIGLHACPADAFDQRTATVRDAAQCLGLSDTSIFVNPDEREIGAVRIRRDAFRAVLLTAQTSCARLPVSSEGAIAQQAVTRNALCARITFAPAARRTNHAIQ